MSTFRALVLEQHDGGVQPTYQDLEPQALPDGDVLVSVDYSSVNYKDGLAVTGKGKIIRSYPMVPGVDFVGTVVESQSDDYSAGDPVILTGWGVGERHWGGYAQMARVKSDWLVPLPKGLTPRQAMIVGTAGFTAMLCVSALEEHGVSPQGQEVLVTGASGGVGSIAVAILAKLGYTVVAVTGRPENHDYLRNLGADSFLRREDVATESSKPLESQRWSGAVDTVGSEMLAGVLRSTSYGGSVAACGLAGGSDLPTSVFPFILRGVNLLGIDSVMCPLPRRRIVWERITKDIPFDKLEAMVQEVSLDDLPTVAEDILAGKVRGRVVVNVRD
jgi:acrylyl-CoA reductase (NADPH)